MDIELIINIVELNAILYYADFISLREVSRTVTDNCKYFFVHKTPVNIAYMSDTTPFFDTTNRFFMQAKHEYLMVKNKFGDEGVMSFLSGICNLAACGCVDAIRMLSCIHQFNDKYTRKKAFKDYADWIKTQTYSHLVTNERGELERIECSRYVAHYEYGTEKDPRVHYNMRNSGRSKVSDGIGTD